MYRVSRFYFPANLEYVRTAGSEILGLSKYVHLANIEQISNLLLIRFHILLIDIVFASEMDLPL